MAQYVQTNQAIIENAQWLGWPGNPQGVANKIIPVATTEIIGPYWVTPIIEFGKVNNWFTEPAGNSSIPPNSFSFKTLRVKSTETGIELYFAILNTDCVTTNTYGTYANDTTGSLPTMPSVLLPIPVIAVPPATTVPGVSNTFYIALPDNPNAFNYQLSYGQIYPFINGVYSGIAFPTGQSTPAGLVTALQSAYGTALNGTFSLITTPIPGSPATSFYSVKLVSTVSGAGSLVDTLGFPISITPVIFAATIPSYLSPIAVNGIKINGINALFPTGGLVVGTANMGSLINALRPMFEPSAVFSIFGSNQIRITTVQNPSYVTQNGVNTAILFS